MLWLNIIFQRPIWLWWGFFFQWVISLWIFSSCAEYCFGRLRLYLLWHILNTPFICVFCSSIFDEKEKYFFRSGREIDYLEKKKQLGSYFQQFISYCIYKVCAFQMHFWKWGERCFFLGDLIIKNNSSSAVTKWWAHQAHSWGNSLKRGVESCRGDFRFGFIPPLPTIRRQEIWANFLFYHKLTLIIVCDRKHFS